MVQRAELETSSRLQRLLWTNEYVCLGDTNIIIEGSFVLEDSQGNALKMVRGALCAHIFVIAECVSRCKTVREVYHLSRGSHSSFDFLSCQNVGLDDMELLWLLPLDNIHLTVSKKASRHGLNVLRLRFCSGQLYHLEFAEIIRDSTTWMAWIQSVDNLRKHRRTVIDGNDSLTSMYIHRKFNSQHSRPTNYDDGEHGYETVSPRGTSLRVTDVHRPKSSQLALDPPVMGQNQYGGEQTLEIHVVEQVNDQMKHSTNVGTSARALDINENCSLRNRKSSTVRFQIQRSSSDVTYDDSMTSLVTCTTESEGSLISAISLDRFLQQLNMKSLFQVCLCVGDYFGQFLFEAGSSGLPKRMASMSAMGHYIEVDDCNMDSDDIHFGFGIERDELRHCSSLPCVLDGEASFVEDLKQVDNLTHKTSLVYLDLTNENEEKQAHVINGHVMLITGEEYQLYNEVIQHRNSPIDLRFATARHPDVVRKKTKFKDTLHVRRNAVATITDDVQSKIKNFTQIHLKDIDTKVGSKKSTKHHKSKKAKRIRSVFRKIKTCKQSTATAVKSDHDPHIFEYITEIEIDDVANELTVIDAELFLRIHESELIECVWLREQRHSKAPNVMACIDFFHRMFGIVVTEILLPILPRERAELLARFTRIADKCLKLRNYNSTKAIVSALQSPAIQRLKSTWGCFELMFPESFRLWKNICGILSDDVPSHVYSNHLRQAMISPPCLPFLGTFLKQVTDFYMRKLSCYQIPEKEHSSIIQRSPSTSQTSQRSYRTDISNFTGSKYSLYQSRSLSNIIDDEKPQKGANGSMKKFFTKILSSSFHVQESVRSLFESQSRMPSRSYLTVTSGDATYSSGDLSIASDLYDYECKPTPCMTILRRRHIQQLIVDYAKNLAQERGMTWQDGRAKNETKGWDYVIDQTFDWSNLFKKVSSRKNENNMSSPLTHRFSNLKLIAEEAGGTHGASLAVILSEYDLTSTLCHFQLCVVRFKLQTNDNVRNFLLKAHYNSDVDNFALSLRRELPINVDRN